MLYFSLYITINSNEETLTTKKIKFKNKTVSKKEKQEVLKDTNNELKMPVNEINEKEKIIKKEIPMKPNNIEIKLENTQDVKYEKIFKAIKSKPEVESVFLNEVYREIQDLYFKKSEEFFWNHYDEIVNI